MDLMRWFRRHRRYLLAGLVVFIMITWGLIPAAQQLLRERPRPWGKLRGAVVSEAEVQSAAVSLRAVLELGLLQPNAYGLLQAPETTPRAAAGFLSLVRDVKAFVFEKETVADSAAAWRFLVLVREAESVGVQVTQEQAAELLRLSPLLTSQKGFSPESYQMFLASRASYGLTRRHVEEALRQLAEVLTLVNLRRESVRASTAEVWESYADAAEQRRVRYIEVNTADFLPLANATDEEVRAFYEKHKSIVPDRAAGRIGYMAPERVKVEYAEAPMEQIAGEVKIEESDIKAHYDAHRDWFVVKEEQPGKAKPEGGASEPAENPKDPAGEGAKADKAGPSAGEQLAAEQAKEKEGEAKAPKPPAGYRFKTLDEARNEIRDKLVEARAKQKAEELLRKVLSELDAVSERYLNEPVPLGQMARRYGLVWHLAQTAGGKELLSGEELKAAMPDGARVAAFAFGVTGSRYSPRAFTSGPVPLICQVLEQRPAETQPFETVAGEVRRDCLRQKALDQATVFTEKLKESVVEAGFEKAAETMSARLANLLGGPEGKGKAPAALTVQESEPFSRGALAVAGIEGPHPAVVEKAFQLAAEEVGVAAEGPPAYQCFVVQVAGREPASREQFAEIGAMFRARYYLPYKQDRVVREWMDGLLKAATGPEQVAG